MAELRSRRRCAPPSTAETLPTEQELAEVVTRKLNLSDMYYFLNVPDVMLPSSSAEGTAVAERNEIYAEVHVYQ